MVVAPDSVLLIDSDTEANFSKQLIDDIFHANRPLTGNLNLTGNLTVGVYSAYNKTSDTWSSCLTDEDTENNNLLTANFGSSS